MSGSGMRDYPQLPNHLSDIRTRYFPINHGEIPIFIPPSRNASLPMGVCTVRNASIYPLHRVRMMKWGVDRGKDSVASYPYP